MKHLSLRHTHVSIHFEPYIYNIIYISFLTDTMAFGLYASSTCSLNCSKNRGAYGCFKRDITYPMGTWYTSRPIQPDHLHVSAVRWTCGGLGPCLWNVAKGTYCQTILHLQKNELQKTKHEIPEQYIFDKNMYSFRRTYQYHSQARVGSHKHLYTAKIKNRLRAL